MAVRCKAHAHLKSAEKPTDCRLCVYDLKERIVELEGNMPADEAPTGTKPEQGEATKPPGSPPTTAGGSQTEDPPKQTA